MSALAGLIEMDERIHSLDMDDLTPEGLTKLREEAVAMQAKIEDAGVIDDESKKRFGHLLSVIDMAIPKIRDTAVTVDAEKHMNCTIRHLSEMRDALPAMIEKLAKLETNPSLSEPQRRAVHDVKRMHEHMRDFANAVHHLRHGELSSHKADLAAAMKYL